MDTLNSHVRQSLKNAKGKTDGAAVVAALGRELAARVKAEKEMVVNVLGEAKAWPDTEYSFEPRGLRQKCSSLFQNTFEMTILILIFICSYCCPSVASCVALVLSHSLLLTTSMPAGRRIFWSAIIQCVLLVLLLILVLYKVFNLLDKDKNFDGPADFHMATYFYYNLGFALEKNETKGSIYRFKTITSSSFIFEISLFVVYSLNLLQLFCKRKALSELKSMPLKVKMVKNYEHARLLDSDSEEEDKKKPQIGTTRADRA